MHRNVNVFIIKMIFKKNNNVYFQEVMKCFCKRNKWLSLNLLQMKIPNCVFYIKAMGKFYTCSGKMINQIFHLGLKHYNVKYN